jgi:hypothetical protein
MPRQSKRQSILDLLDSLLRDLLEPLGPLLKPRPPQPVPIPIRPNPKRQRRSPRSNDHGYPTR